MSGDLVELAQRFVRLSGELDLTRDAMKRLLMPFAIPATIATVRGLSFRPEPLEAPSAGWAAAASRRVAWPA